MYNDVRKAAEVHRTVRSYIKKIAVPGVKLIDMCETLESSVRALIQERGLQARHPPFFSFLSFPKGAALSYRVTGVPARG